MVNKVGSGATSEVWKAQKDGKDFALKVYKSTIDQMKCMENVMNELNFASKVSDAFAIAPIEAFVSRNRDANTPTQTGQEGQVCVSYDLAQNGELFKYLSYSGRMATPLLKFYAK